MESRHVLALFESKRLEVYARLDTLRNDVDVWIERHRSEDPTITALAELEYLLAMRHSILAEITKLEDEVIQKLLLSMKPLATRPLAPTLPQQDGKVPQPDAIPG